MKAISYLSKIYHALWTIICLMATILVCLLLLMADIKAEEGKIIVEIAGVKKEYNALDHKVVKSIEICNPPEDPCLERRKMEKEAIREIHKKLKFECPPCRKCVNENAEISRLRDLVLSQKAQIVSLEKLLSKPNEKIVEKEVKVEVEVEKPVMKRHVLSLYGAYADDGILPTPYLDDDGYLSAETYQSFVGGAGYTYFLNESLGLGIFGMAGQIQRVIGGSVSLAL